MTSNIPVLVVHPELAYVKCRGKIIYRVPAPAGYLFGSFWIPLPHNLDKAEMEEMLAAILTDCVVNLYED